MTLDEHEIQGLPKITKKSLRAKTFERLMQESGYSPYEQKRARGNRWEIYWEHNEYPNVLTIYTNDKDIVITAYHI